MSTGISSPLGRTLCSAFLACTLSAHARETTTVVAGTMCLKPAMWYTLDRDTPRSASGRDILTRMAARDIVLLGESHDNYDHHEWQLQTLAALHLLRPNMVIGFESFPRRVQPALDEWVAGQLNVRQFLEKSEWAKVWSMPADLYLPLFRFARINAIPMVALNVDQALIDTIAKKGWDAVPQDMLDGISRPAPPSKTYRDFLFQVFQEHRHSKGSGDEEFGYFVESQTTWDRAMAEALAHRLGPDKGESRPLVVGIMGSGHIRFGYGVPHQLRDLGIDNFGTLLPVDPKDDCGDIRRNFADAIFSISELSEDHPPPRLGVRLEKIDGGVKLVEVRPGSLAEKTGFKPGDVIVSVAGKPADRMSVVISAVQQQPQGTWLPMQIRRGGQTRDIVVKFPRQQ